MNCYLFPFVKKKGKTFQSEEITSAFFFSLSQRSFVVTPLLFGFKTPAPALVQLFCTRNSVCFIGTWGNSSDVCPGSSGALCIARRGWGSAVPVSVLLQRDSGGLPRAESAERAAEHSPQRRATVSAPKYAIH